MPKKVAISQSNYIPWKGYFDLIASVDEFIIFDDVQYTRRDWRNRNLIKTSTGTIWLTVPVKVKNKYHQSIYGTQIDGDRWASKHWKTLQQFYSRSEYSSEIFSMLQEVYCDEQYTHLSTLNVRLIELVCQYLKITTPIRHSRNFVLKDGKTERLVGLCNQVDADIYISGPAAKSYLDERIFRQNKIDVEWFSYESYRQYPQQGSNFTHHVSILDMLFNCGESARSFMRY